MHAVGLKSSDYRVKTDNKAKVDCFITLKLMQSAPRSGLQSFISDFLSHLEEQDVFSFYSLLTPNALSLFEKTIYMFSATDNSIHEMEEKRVKMYFENFVMKLNCETLSTLLVKWCYSDCLCMEHLYVRFLANSISERPHFDPNETTLTLSSVYTSQEELHQLMMSELES